MTRPLVFATRNKGKLVELRELLAGVEVLSIDEVGKDIPEVVEDGVTGFVVNSMAESVDALGHIHLLNRSVIRSNFERRFTARRMALDYLAAYRSLTEAAQPRIKLVSSAE